MPYTIIKNAIERKESLTGKYQDYIRFFSAHALGEDQRGTRAGLGFQYSGGRVVAGVGCQWGGHWRFFRLPLLSGARSNNDKWVDGASGKPLHLFSKIDVQVFPHPSQYVGVIRQVGNFQ